MDNKEISSINGHTKEQSKVLLDDYILDKKIGSGSFGEVYRAIDTKTKEYVALKIEEKKHGNLLALEYKIYTKLEKAGFIDGLPKVYKYIETSQSNIMVMELLDKSLEYLFNQKKKFTNRTVFLLGIEITNLLRTLHNIGYIHRDIKPNNFMIGSGENKGKIYIMDFGLSKQFINKGKHISYTVDKSLIGTARYASTHIHMGMEPSRRDDIESVGYMLVYFMKGSLPWQGLKKEKTEDHLEHIGEIKLLTKIEKLCEGLPDCFAKYINYAKSLKFEQEPDYEYLINLFMEELMREQEQNNGKIIQFEWLE